MVVVAKPAANAARRYLCRMSNALPRAMYKVSEVAAALGVSDDTVRRLVAAGEIEGTRVGGLILIPRASLERLVLVGASGDGARIPTTMDAPRSMTMNAGHSTRRGGR